MGEGQREGNTSFRLFAAHNSVQKRLQPALPARSQLLNINMHDVIPFVQSQSRGFAFFFRRDGVGRPAVGQVSNSRRIYMRAAALQKQALQAVTISDCGARGASRYTHGSYMHVD